MSEDLDRLTGELVRYLRLTTRAKAVLVGGEPGADPSALLLLGPLVTTGPLRVTDLAELKQADPSTVSRQAAQLVRAGYVRKEPDPADGRAYRLAATPTGEEAFRRIQDRRRTLIETALREWPADRVAAFAELFGEFNSSVEQLIRSEPATGRNDTTEENV
jgi:DNA-binding MarR family transcriptional regulator